VRFDKNTCHARLNSASLVEAGCAAALVFARMRVRIVFVMKDAGADRDRAKADVTVIDMPSVLAFGVAAAGEDGHVRIKAHPAAPGKLSYGLG